MAESKRRDLFYKLFRTAASSYQVVKVAQGAVNLGRDIYNRHLEGHVKRGMEIAGDAKSAFIDAVIDGTTTTETKVELLSSRIDRYGEEVSAMEKEIDGMSDLMSRLGVYAQRPGLDVLVQKGYAVVMQDITSEIRVMEARQDELEHLLSVNVKHLESLKGKEADSLVDEYVAKSLRLIGVVDSSRKKISKALTKASRVADAITSDPDDL